MDCACGGHHHDGGCATRDARPLPLSRPLFGLTGRLSCTDARQLAALLAHLPDHVAASRAEPGCLRFDVAQSDDPLIWTVAELFIDENAFRAHQTRTAATPWFDATKDIARDYSVGPVQPAIRDAEPSDLAAIRHLSARAAPKGMLLLAQDCLLAHAAPDGVTIHPHLRGSEAHRAFLGAL